MIIAAHGPNGKHLLGLINTMLDSLVRSSHESWHRASDLTTGRSVPIPESCTAANGSHYSIASSARTSNVAGMMSPRDFAAFRLMTNRALPVPRASAGLSNANVGGGV